ncbi:MAG TPA: multidrug ABC transporter permease, partial [Firmicutes bacterium]|nr:multidrug ABC transporter permease [Bacillota bacterium]
LIPIAIMGYIPAATLLGRPAAGTCWAVLASIAFLFMSLGFWRLMQKKYTSAGG